MTQSLTQSRDRDYEDHVTRSCDAQDGGLQSYDWALTLHDRDVTASTCDVAPSSSPAAATITSLHPTTIACSSSTKLNIIIIIN